MNKKNNYSIIYPVIFILLSINSSVFGAPGEKEKSKSGFEFTIIKNIRTTSVKDQGFTATCWSFGTISFIETELIRYGKGDIDLSEMFIVRYTYPSKTRNYVRMHGETVFGPGSLAHDVINVIREFGIVPEEIYKGRYLKDKRLNHIEMDAVLRGAIDGIVKNDNGKISNVWPNAIDSILDAYLGKHPENFIYNGKTYTPKIFLKECAIDPDDYIEITSYTHHPFYSRFILEIPDNWSLGKFYNLPINDFILVINYAIENGYSVCWEGDTSEKSFNLKKGIAILPLKDWYDRTEAEKDSICNSPETEKKVTQELRQELFNNYASEDNHIMHIIGIAKDQNNTGYYIAKDSRGTKDKKHSGFIYMSESYILAKTISVMINKYGLPKNLIKKLAIK
ncbi:MAG: C1 family peptidase [Spirochaetota bacterium]